MSNIYTLVFQSDLAITVHIRNLLMKIKRDQYEQDFIHLGIACLALAGLLAALSFVLPPNYVTFIIGGQSLLWIPLCLAPSCQ